MLKISTITFAQLKHAEHVSLFCNVKNAIDKATPTKLDMTDELYNAYSNAVALEQDIVNRSVGSIYTPEMKALDDDRDRLFKRIHNRLVGVTLASASDPEKAYENIVVKNLLNKYGNDITLLPYQEESAVIAGFILDARNFLDEDAIELIGIKQDLTELETANKGFADQYHERVVEKAGTDGDLATQLRKDTEEMFRLLACHIEFKANHDATLVGAANTTLLAVINQLIHDAQQRLDIRLGRKSEATTESENTATTDESEGNGGGGHVDVPVFNK